MTDTDITSSSIAYPLDEGIGSVADGNELWDSAGQLAAAVTHLQGSYVRNNELQFNQVDTTNDQVDVGTGRAFVLFSSVDVQSGRGGTSPPAYDTTLPSEVVIAVDVVSEIVDLGLATGAVNDLWLAVDSDGTTTGTAGGVYIRHGNGLSAPSDPSVKLGTVDTSDGSTTRASDGAALTGLREVSTDQATIDGDAAGGFGTTNSVAYTLDSTGWTQASATRPAFITVEGRAETDGTDVASIVFRVDESGGTSADYGHFFTWADPGLGSGGRDLAGITIYVPAGGQYEIASSGNPNGNNSVDDPRELIL